MNLPQQIKRFLLAGGINTAFGYFIYVCGILFFNLSYFWAVVWSYVIGTTFSYFMFRRFVFTAGARGWGSYLRFIRLYVVLFFVNEFLMFLFVSLADWNRLLAQLAAIMLCAALSFVINRMFVFNETA